MTSEIRTNSLKSRAGFSTVTMTDSGPMFSGITTFVDNSGFTFGVGSGSSIFTPATNVLTFGTNSNERLRIGSSGQIGLSGANYGTSGQVLTSQGSGSAATWTNISSTSDKIEEGDSKVEVVDSGTGYVNVVADSGVVARFGKENNNRTYMIIGNNIATQNNYGTNAGNVIIASNTTTRTATLRVFTSGVGLADDTVTGIIDFAAQQSGTGGQTVSKIESSLRGGVENKSDLIFSTSNAGSPTEKIRILADGKLGIGIASPAVLTHIYDSTSTSTATEQFRISGGNRSADTFETGFRFFTESPSANGNRHYRFTANGNTGLHIQGYETSSGNAAVDRQINLNPDGGAVAIGTDRTGAQTWRNGRTLEIGGGGGNNVAQLALASNRGDGEQTVGSIVFADHTQSSTKRNLAIIECDKKGSTANNRGGSLTFATKSDGSTSPDNAWQMTAGGTYGGSTTDYSTLRHMKGVTSYSSAYNSGDIYIHIDGLYNLPGNAWWYTQVLLQSTEIVGTQAGSHHYLTSLTLMGIAQWNSVGVNNVVGSASVSISASTSTSVTLFINVNDSSRGPITCWASNTVGQDGPIISFS